MTTLGGHFGHPIVEDRPLATPFGIMFDHFGGHFREPIDEDRPLATTPFVMAFDYFGHPIDEDRPLATSPCGMAFDYSGGSLFGANCRGQAISNQALWNTFGQNLQGKPWVKPVFPEV